MDKRLARIGIAATLVIAAILFYDILHEPFRQRDAQVSGQHDAITRATSLYAANCVACHGAFGEGLNNNPALNTVGVRTKDYSDLFKTIERGRLNTAMIGYGASEGGQLTDPEIDDLVTL